ncbi:MAG: DUF2953 domain-containing protein [bacterium]|nr:DUF2953 domain-containing protein [bacterium]
MAWWLGAAGLALASVVAWSWLPVRFSFRLPEGGPGILTVSALGISFRRELGPRVFQRLSVALTDPGRIADGFSEIPLGEWLGLLRAQLPLLRWMLRGTRITEASLSARVGTGDAASTALLVGWCWAGLGLVAPWTGIRPRLSLRPEYGRSVLEVDFRAAVALRVARLIGFGFRLAWRVLPLIWRRIARPGGSNIRRESGQEGVGI